MKGLLYTLKKSRKIVFFRISHQLFFFVYEFKPFQITDEWWYSDGSRVTRSVVELFVADGVMHHFMFHTFWDRNDKLWFWHNLYRSYIPSQFPGGAESNKRVCVFPLSVSISPCVDKCAICMWCKPLCSSLTVILPSCCGVIFYALTAVWNQSFHFLPILRKYYLYEPFTLQLRNILLFIFLQSI